MNKHSFAIGDTCHYNIGSDIYPGVVVKVSPASVTIESLGVHLDMTQRGGESGRYHEEGDPGVSFHRIENAVGEKFTFRKNGRLVRQGCTSGTLHKGAVSYYDPSF